MSFATKLLLITKLRDRRGKGSSVCEATSRRWAKVIRTGELTQRRREKRTRQRWRKGGGRGSLPSAWLSWQHKFGFPNNHCPSLCVIVLGKFSFRTCTLFQLHLYFFCTLDIFLIALFHLSDHTRIFLCGYRHAIASVVTILPLLHPYNTATHRYTRRKNKMQKASEHSQRSFSRFSMPVNRSGTHTTIDSRFKHACKQIRVTHDHRLSQSNGHCIRLKEKYKQITPSMYQSERAIQEYIGCKSKMQRAWAKISEIAWERDKELWGSSQRSHSKSQRALDASERLQEQTVQHWMSSQRLHSFGRMQNIHQST